MPSPTSKQVASQQHLPAVVQEPTNDIEAPRQHPEEVRLPAPIDLQDHGPHQTSRNKQSPTNTEDGLYDEDEPRQAYFQEQENNCSHRRKLDTSSQSSNQNGSHGTQNSRVSRRKEPCEACQSKERGRRAA